MTRRRPVPLLAALLLVLAACTSTAEPSATDRPTEAATPSASAAATASTSEDEDDGTAEERVRIRRSQFEPAELTVAAGTEVVFLNADAFPHTVSEGTNGEVVEDPIVDEELEQNGSVRVVFDEPGTYDITCGIHPSMQMTIIVEG